MPFTLFYFNFPVFRPWHMVETKICIDYICFQNYIPVLVKENDTNLICMLWHWQRSHKRNIGFHTDYLSYIIYLPSIVVKGKNNFNNGDMRKWSLIIIYETNTTMIVQIIYFTVYFMYWREVLRIDPGNIWHIFSLYSIKNVKSHLIFYVEYASCFLIVKSKLTM